MNNPPAVQCMKIYDNFLHFDGVVECYIVLSSGTMSTVMQL